MKFVYEDSEEVNEGTISNSDSYGSKEQNSSGSSPTHSKDKKE